MTHEQAIESMAAERYVLDEMPEVERYRFEEHFFECEDCAETMRLWESMRTNAKGLFTAVPAETAPDVAAAGPGRRFSLRLVLPYAAAAVLAVALAQQTWLSNRGVDDGQVLALTMLRPAARGELPAVILPPEEKFVGLAADLDGVDAGTPVSYRVTRADGTVVDSDTDAAPPPGTPLVVSVPASRLRTGGPFVLSVTVGGPASSSREYRFTAIER